MDIVDSIFWLELSEADGISKISDGDDDANFIVNVCPNQCPDIPYK